MRVCPVVAGSQRLHPARDPSRITWSTCEAGSSMVNNFQPSIRQVPPLTYAALIYPDIISKPLSCTFHSKHLDLKISIYCPENVRFFMKKQNQILTYLTIWIYVGRSISEVNFQEMAPQ